MNCVERIQYDQPVSGAQGGSFIVLIEQDRTDQADDGISVGEHALHRVGRVQLGSMLGWEGHIGEHIGLGLVEEGRELGQLGAKLVGDLAPLRSCSLGIVLGEGRGDKGGDDAPATLTGMRHRVAHEVHAAALPRGAGGHSAASLLFRFGLTGLSQPYACPSSVLVDELDAGGFERALDQLAARRGACRSPTHRRHDTRAGCGLGLAGLGPVVI